MRRTKVLFHHQQMREKKKKRFREQNLQKVVLSPLILNEPRCVERPGSLIRDVVSLSALFMIGKLLFSSSFKHEREYYYLFSLFFFRIVFTCYSIRVHLQNGPF